MIKHSDNWKQTWDDGDIIVILITVISIIITEFASCLTSQISKGSIPEPTKLVTQSMPTTHTSISNTKTQRLSPSTKPRSTTVGLKKVDGIGLQDIQSSPTVSSARSKPSKPTSNTSKSTKSKSSRASASQQRTQTMTSVLQTSTPSTILQSDLAIADE